MSRLPVKVIKNVLWLKVDKPLFQTDEDIYFEAVNVPPANTDYCRNDILDLFYNELDFFQITLTSLFMAILTPILLNLQKKKQKKTNNKNNY